LFRVRDAMIHGREAEIPKRIYEPSRSRWGIAVYYHWGLCTGGYRGVG